MELYKAVLHNLISIFNFNFCGSSYNIIVKTILVPNFPAQVLMVIRGPTPACGNHDEIIYGINNWETGRASLLLSFVGLCSFPPEAIRDEVKYRECVARQS